MASTGRHLPRWLRIGLVVFVVVGACVVTQVAASAAPVVVPVSDSVCAAEDLFCWYEKEQNVTAFQILKHHANTTYPLSPLALRRRAALVASLPDPTALPPVLGYVTPWNKDGHRRAVEWRDRLSIVSPTWYDLSPPTTVEGRVFVPAGGDHQFNQTWVKEVVFGIPKPAPTPAAASAECSTEAGGAAASCNGKNVAAVTPQDVPPPKLVTLAPRFRLEGWQSDHLRNFLSTSEIGTKTRGAVIKAIADVFKRRQPYFGGVVFEWGYMDLSTPGLRSGFVPFLVDLRMKLHEIRTLAQKEFESGAYSTLPFPLAPKVIVVIPADLKLAGSAQLKWLVEDGYIDHVSVMSYDYTVSGRAASDKLTSQEDGSGPNAPLRWFRSIMNGLLPKGGDAKATSSVRPHHILMGLNHYGYIFRGRGKQPDAVLGRDVIKVFKQEYLAERKRVEQATAAAATKKAKSTAAGSGNGTGDEPEKMKSRPNMKWIRNATGSVLVAEHKFHAALESGGADATVYYPTGASLLHRIDVATEKGAGLSIWELGQGLEYFGSLLLP